MIYIKNFKEDCFEYVYEYSDSGILLYDRDNLINKQITDKDLICFSNLLGIDLNNLDFIIYNWRNGRKNGGRLYLKKEYNDGLSRL